MPTEMWSPLRMFTVEAFNREFLNTDFDTLTYLALLSLYTWWLVCRNSFVVVVNNSLAGTSEDDCLLHTNLGFDYPFYT